MANKPIDEQCPKCEWSMWCHDDTRCLQIQLSLTQIENRKLKTSLAEWKATWYRQRDIIADLAWAHLNCPNQTRKIMEHKPNTYHHPNEQVCRDNNHVYLKTPDDWKLVGYGLTKEATDAIERLMKIQ